MRERPGQRCLWSEPASRWRPTRDPTGWKCLQNTLTHWQRKTRLHSCFPAIVCTASSVCIFILCLFIKFYVIFPLLYFLRKKKKKKKKLHSTGVLGHPRLSCSTVQPLFGSIDGGTAEQDKGRVQAQKHWLPSSATLRKEKLLFRKTMWAGVFLPGLFSLSVRESTALFCSPTMMQILQEVSWHCSHPSSGAHKPTTAHAALCRAETG